MTVGNPVRPRVRLSGLRVALLTLQTMAVAMPLVLAAPVSAQRFHTVRSGQTLSQIARRYRVQVRDLAAANRMRIGSTLRPGQEIEIPPRGVIFVRRGDSLSALARRHDTSVRELRRINRLRAGSGLRSGQRLRLPGFEASSGRGPQDYGEPSHPGRVDLRGRFEGQEVQLVDADGLVPHESLVVLGKLMRREEEDAIVLPEARLAALIALISDHFGGRALTIVSGYRPAGGRTSEGSRHVAGAAADIRIRDVSKRAIWDFCRSLRNTGCGFYPRSSFTHVDVRTRAAQWVDWSRPGGRARYGTLRRPYRRRERRSPNRPRVSRRVSRPRALPLEVEIREPQNPPPAADASPQAAAAP